MLGLALLLPMLSACSLVDLPFPSRGYGINVGAGTMREDVMLLNIVRASRFEPMNFMTLSKYTGQGQMGSSLQAVHPMGILFDVVKLGPNPASTVTVGNANKYTATAQANASATGTFDLSPLENREFYSAFMQQLDLTTINLLVNAGLSREIVLHALVKTVRVQDGQNRWYNFHNDPSNDNWNGSQSESAHRHCAGELRDGSAASHAPFVHPVWLGTHENDCNYQKFLHFLQQALSLGMTTETTEVANIGAKTVTRSETAKAESVKAENKGEAGAGTKSKSKAPDLALSERRSETRSDVKYISDTHYCFDAAVAREYGKDLPPEAICNTEKRTERRPRLTYPGKNITAVQPILRSPYSVMQYFGQLLASNSAYRVELIDAGTPRMPSRDRSIFTVKTDGVVGSGCFASVRVDGVLYCVPSQGANNTKEIFVLLNTLVNLSTRREALTTTPTVQVLQ